jgi:hypothetical protein
MGGSPFDDMPIDRRPAFAVKSFQRLPSAPIQMIRYAIKDMGTGPHGGPLALTRYVIEILRLG